MFTDFPRRQHVIDLASRQVRSQVEPCQDLEDFLGGIPRGFKLLEEHSVEDAYDPQARLVMNLGILSGTQFMTGLRTFFLAYSPLKRSLTGKPSAMWSAGSGKFGTKLRFLGIEEVVFTGRCEVPSLLHITAGEEGPEFRFEPAADLQGLRVNAKIQTLHGRYPEAHFAVIGPAGENYQHVRFASIALSTENQLKSGDPKPRFCGRGGIGGVMGSKNLLAIVADVEDQVAASADNFKTLNREVARGDGSRRFRDAKTDGLGGTWANYKALQPVHALPERNFNPTGTDVSVPLFRDNVEALDQFVIKDESCYRCGIRCHKNLYDAGENGKPGKFRAKLDFEPLDLLSSNLGIFDVDHACTLVELVDELGMDSISCGVTLSYAMEYNERFPDSPEPLANGIRYGDFQKAYETIVAIGEGRLPELGQGTLRLAEARDATEFAMQCKGVELPAYLPQTNPGYPWALAGGHMSMRTYLLLLNERETSLEYWLDAITSPTKGLSILRDDILGACKFSGLPNTSMVEALNALTGLTLTTQDLERVILRTFLRGYRLEKQQGFTESDYRLPADAMRPYPQIELPDFITPEFFGELRTQVIARFDQLLEQEGLSTS